MNTTPARKPNVIVFFTDQQRWDCSSLQGNPLDLMPNFDRLATRGTHLRNMFTCQPVCGPARSCLQTGQYATRTGVWRNGLAMATDAVTLAKQFNAAGYQTGYIGKWHLAGQAPIGPVEPALRGGYQSWLASHALEFTSRAYSTTVYDNDGKPHQFPGYRVDALTDAAIRFIDREKENPFFLFVSYIEPHHQNDADDYPPPDGYREKYTGRWIPPDLAALGGTTHQHLGGYYGMVKRLDEALGRMTDALKSLGLTDNTIVLFTSDHGCHFKTRNDEYKRSCHDASIHVPTAIWGPGFDRGGDLSAMISLVDLPPTLLEGAGLPVPDTMQGRSIVPLVNHQKVDWPEEVFVQISESQVGRCIRTARWKYSVEAIGKNPVKDSGSDEYTETTLYDLAADPYELKNLIGMDSHEKVAIQLRAILCRRMKEAGEAEPKIIPAPTRVGFQRVVEPSELPNAKA